MPRNSKLTKQVLKLSDGLLGTVVDMVLGSFYVMDEFVANPHASPMWLEYKANQQLEQLNYSKIKRTIRYLVQQGYLEKGSLDEELPAITKKGSAKIKKLIPCYNPHKNWDGKIYVVSYDLPNSRTSERNKLRQILKQIGCGKLQLSVWLTAYDPKQALNDLIESQNLKKLIVVSVLDTRVGIGSMGLRQLMSQVYDLPKINRQYQSFLNTYKTGAISKQVMAFSYWSILKVDPQLPAKLLPKDWQGDVAHNLFLELLQ